MSGFLPSIKVYAYADDHDPERKVILSVYLQMLQVVVIQSLTGSMLTVDSFIPGMETQVCMALFRPCVWNCWGNTVLHKNRKEN